jgi:hypothetical protein
VLAGSGVRVIGVCVGCIGACVAFEGACAMFAENCGRCHGGKALVGVVVMMTWAVQPCCSYVNISLSA